jgi:hypothetical protein
VVHEAGDDYFPAVALDHQRGHEHGNRLAHHDVIDAFGQRHEAVEQPFDLPLFLG